MLVASCLKPCPRAVVVLLAVWAAIAGAALPLPAHAKPIFTSFDPPGSVETLPTGINGHGTVVGTYDTADNAVHGFFRTSDGTITTFDDPQGDGFTAAIGIADNGSIAGYYGDNQGYAHAYFRTIDGSFVNFDPRTSVYTEAYAINKKDAVAGIYLTAGNAQYGFVRSPRGKITTIAPGRSQADVESINDKGTVVGTVGHGFERFRDGTIAYFDPPKSAYTEPLSISDAGSITGYYKTDDFNHNHGFVRALGGTIATFDVPGSVDTSPLGINVKSAVTGTSITDNEGAPSFLRKADGRIIIFYFPGSTNTEAMCINRTGVIAGSYVDSKGVTHGFLRTP